MTAVPLAHRFASRELFAFSGALLVALAACPAVDTTAPKAPRVDVATARTSRATWTIRGSCEPGATVLVTRLPLFDDGAAPAPAVASDGTFSVDVPLVPLVKNVFVVSAMDSAGLGSAGTEVVVEQVARAPQSLALWLADAHPRIGVAGTAPLSARALLRFDDGSSSAGRLVRFLVTGLENPMAPVVARVGDDGLATASIDLPGLVRGSLVAEETASELRSEPADFSVRTGLPVSASLELSATAFASGTPSATLTAAARTDIATRVSARDGSGQQVSAAYDLAVSPPEGALLAGGVLHFLTAGEYTITARVDETANGAPILATGRVTVTAVQATAPARLLATFPAAVEAGKAVPFTLAFVDNEGTTTNAQPLSVSSSDAAAAVQLASRTVTHATAGRRVITFAANGPDAKRYETQVVTVVRPGPAATLDLFLAGTAAPLESPRPVSPAATLEITATARDAQRNEIPDASFQLLPDADVRLFGTTATAPAAPGTYAIAGAIPGTSARGVVVFTVSPQPAASVAVQCPVSAIAGVPFRCSAAVTDANGVTLSPALTWSSLPSAAEATSAGNITITTAGTATVIATVAGTNVSGLASVVVAPGPAARVNLAVSPSSLAVGSTATVTTFVADAYGNAVPAPVRLSTDLPGGYAGGGRLSSVSRAGTWRVVATAQAPDGSGLSATQTVTVTAGPASRIVLSLSSTTATVGSSVRVSTAQTDANGNSVAGEPVTLLVDDARPDGIASSYVAGQLTIFTPGPHRISATTPSASDSTILDVTATRDATGPDVQIALDRTVAGDASTVLYKPGQLVRLTVRARDDQGLTGVRVRLSGALGTLLDTAVPLATRPREFEQTFALTLPASRVGSFTAAASASDAGNASRSATPLVGLVDAHYDRFTVTNLPAATTIRSVSIDPAMTATGGLALPSGAPAVIATTAAGLVVGGFDGAGQLQSTYALSPMTDPSGLAASASGLLFVGGHLGPGAAEADFVYRLFPGVAAPQAYTVPPLAAAAPTRRMTGIAADAKSASPRVFAAEADNATDPVIGRLWSMPLRETTSAFSVSGLVAGTLSDWRPRHLCVADQSPAELYFTGERTGNKSGLYKVTLSGGDVPSGLLIPATVYEQDASSTVLGPCAVISSGRVLFATHAAVSGPGRLQTCTTANACAGGPVTVLSAADLGPMGGLARSASGTLYGSERLGRVFRVEGSGL